MPKTAGPFRIVTIASHTVTIDEKGIPNTVSDDRVSPALVPESTQSNNMSPTEPTETSQETHERKGDKWIVLLNQRMANNKSKETEDSNQKGYEEKVNDTQTKQG